MNTSHTSNGSFSSVKFRPRAAAFTKMIFQGIKDDKKINDVIAYLKSKS